MNTAELMRRAADVIDQACCDLYQSHTVFGRWMIMDIADHRAREQYEMDRDLAEKLRQAAADLDL